MSEQKISVSDQQPQPQTSQGEQKTSEQQQQQPRTLQGEQKMSDQQQQIPAPQWEQHRSQVKNTTKDNRPQQPRGPQRNQDRSQVEYTTKENRSMPTSTQEETRQEPIHPPSALDEAVRAAQEALDASSARGQGSSTRCSESRLAGSMQADCSQGESSPASSTVNST